MNGECMKLNTHNSITKQYQTSTV